MRACSTGVVSQAHLGWRRSEAVARSLRFRNAGGFCCSGSLLEVRSQALLLNSPWISPPRGRPDRRDWPCSSTPVVPAEATDNRACSPWRGASVMTSETFQSLHLIILVTADSGRSRQFSLNSVVSKPGTYSADSGHPGLRKDVFFASPASTSTRQSLEMRPRDRGKELLSPILVAVLVEGHGLRPLPESRLLSPRQAGSPRVALLPKDLGVIFSSCRLRRKRAWHRSAAKW